MKNYYLILGITQTSTEKEIKVAYRKLAMEWHPDKNKQFNAHIKFIEINEAYEILSDSFKREEYDKILLSKQENIYSEQFTKWQRNAKTKAETYSQMDIDTFSATILDEIKLAAQYTPAFGCFIFLVIGVFVNLWATFEIGPIGFLSVILFSALAIHVYNKHLSSYSKDRKNLKN